MLIRKIKRWWTSYLQQKTSKSFCDRYFEVLLPSNFAVIDTISLQTGTLTYYTYILLLYVHSPAARENTIFDFYILVRFNKLL